MDGVARPMKGSKCKCGFATTSIRTKCPRCGREMRTSEWQEKGKVLSFVELQVTPQGFDNPCDMALVEIEENGPKIICWTTDKLEDDEEVVVSEFKGKYQCSPKAEFKERTSKPD